MLEDQLLETVFCVPWHIQGRNLSGERISFTEREKKNQWPFQVLDVQVAHSESGRFWMHHRFPDPTTFCSFFFLSPFCWIFSENECQFDRVASFFIPHLHLLSIPISLSLSFSSSHLLTIFLWLSLFKKHLFSLSLKIRHVSYLVNYFYLNFLSSDAFSFLRPQPWIRSLSLGSENSLLFQKTQLYVYISLFSDFVEWMF